MPNYLKTIISILGIFLGSFTLAYAAGLTVPQGGTGVTSIASGQLVAGAGPLSVTTVATTTAACSGSSSCTPFVVIGSSPITISATGGGGSGTVSTSTHEVANQLALWTSNSATPALLGQITNTTNGFVLGLSGGVPAWLATTTFSSGLSYAN